MKLCLCLSLAIFAAPWCAYFLRLHEPGKAPATPAPAFRTNPSEQQETQFPQIFLVKL